MVDGLLILVAGAVLLTPGMITDTVGFALLIPQVRTLVKKWLVSRFKNRTTVHFQSHPDGPGSETDAPEQPPNATIIDAEFTRRPSDDA